MAIEWWPPKENETKRKICMMCWHFCILKVKMTKNVPVRNMVRDVTALCHVYGVKMCRGCLAPGRYVNLIRQTSFKILHKLMHSAQNFMCRHIII